MSGITAAVVGVILNLSIWFGLHVVFAKVDERHFGPLRLYVSQGSTLNVAAAASAHLAAYLLLYRKWSVFAVLGLCTALGAGWYWGSAALAQ